MGVNNKLKISITIDSEVYNGLKKYCRENGAKISSVIELVVKKFLKERNYK